MNSETIHTSDPQFVVNGSESNNVSSIDLDAIPHETLLAPLGNRDKAAVMKRGLRARKKPTRAGLRETLFKASSDEDLSMRPDSLLVTPDPKLLSTAQTIPARPHGKSELPAIPKTSPRSTQQMSLMMDLNQSVKLPSLKSKPLSQNIDPLPEAASVKPPKPATIQTYSPATSPQRATAPSPECPPHLPPKGYPMSSQQMSVKMDLNRSVKLPNLKSQPHSQNIDPLPEAAPVRPPKPAALHTYSPATSPQRTTALAAEHSPHAPTRGYPMLGVMASQQMSSASELPPSFNLPSLKSKMLSQNYDLLPETGLVRSQKTNDIHNYSPITSHHHASHSRVEQSEFQRKSGEFTSSSPPKVSNSHHHEDPSRVKRLGHQNTHEERDGFTRPHSTKIPHSPEPYVPTSSMPDLRHQTVGADSQKSPLGTPSVEFHNYVPRKSVESSPAKRSDDRSRTGPSYINTIKPFRDHNHHRSRHGNISPASKKKVVDSSPDKESRPLVKLRKTEKTTHAGSIGQPSDSRGSAVTVRDQHSTKSPPSISVQALRPLKPTNRASQPDTNVTNEPEPKVTLRNRRRNPPASEIQLSSNNSGQPDWIKKANDKRQRASMIVCEQENPEQTELESTAKVESGPVLKLPQNPTKMANNAASNPREIRNTPPRRSLQKQNSPHEQTVPEWKRELNSRNLKNVKNRYSSIEVSNRGTPIPTRAQPDSPSVGGDTSPSKPVWEMEINRLSLSKRKSRGSLREDCPDSGDVPEFIKLARERQSRQKHTENKDEC